MGNGNFVDFNICLEILFFMEVFNFSLYFLFLDENLHVLIPKKETREFRST